ncbi:MAG: PKD domain-containing protein, partial [Bacteroidota bacterium]
TDFATPGYTSLWLPDSATTDSIWVSPDSNQLFFLHILDSLDNLIAKDSVLIGLFPRSTLDLGEDFSFCTDSIQIAPNAGIWLSYDWDDGSADSSRWIRESGIYSLEVMDSFGCNIRDTIEISQEMPVMSGFSWIEDSFMVAFTDSSQLADSLFWDFGDGNMSMAENPIHTYNSAGTYTVSLISVNACSRDTSTQDVFINGWPTSIPPAILQAFLHIQPQPAQERVHLHFSHEAFRGERLVLYNLQGQAVRDLGEIQEDKMILERERLASGIYLLRIGNLARKIWFE